MKRDGKGGDDYAHRVHDDTRRFGQELLAENERLRKLAANLQSERLLLEDRLLALQEEQYRHEREKKRLERELAEIESENRSFSERYLEVERQSSNLANLYVAAYQLHATLDREAVLGSIQEIVANLIGSEQVAIFEREGNELWLAASNGIDAERYRHVTLGSGQIGQAAASGEPYVEQEGAAPESGDDALTACVPLVLDGEVVGAVAIFRLLPQKTHLQDTDHELFSLLATHAATALYSSSLRARAAGTRP